MIQAEKVRATLPILVVVLIWEATSRFGLKQAPLFPPPSKVAAAFVDMIRTGELVTDLWASSLRVVVGFAAGSLAGVLLGLLTGRNRRIAAAIAPILQFLRPLPPVAIIPLVIVWLGIGEGAKIFSIGFAVLFPVWLNTHIGARQISVRLLWSASTLCHSRRRLFWKVIFPASLPLINAGLRNGIAIAFVMVFVSELAGASEGIGYEISAAHLSYRIDRMIADLAILGAGGALADFLFARATARVFPWLRFAETK